MIDPTIVLLANATVEKRLAQELTKVYAAEKIVGPKGEPGKDGKDGLKGDKGDKGEKGDRGEMGPRGLPGKDGVDGKDGRDGRDGKDGVSKAGVQGPPGRDGRGIERLMIAPDGSVVVLFTDGQTQNIGQAQINNVTNVNGGGGLLPDHYIINNVSVNGSILTITCNNNKRFEVTLPSGGGGGSSVWGSITGTLSAQTDLQTALNGKANTTHTHAISDVTGLVAALAGKSDTTHTHADATTSTSGFMSGADKTKLNGIAAGATVNSPDATLLSRANHTGTQTSSTISDFASSVIATVLTGFTIAGTRTAIIATDSVLVAFGKVQKYFNDLSALAFSGNASDLAGTKTSTFISDFTTAAQTAAPAETTTTIGNLTNGATAKTTPVDADLVPLADSASSFILRKVTWANIKATLKTYFDTLYAAVSHTHVKANITDFQHSITDTTAHSFPGGTTTFLRGDGTFAVPAGGSGSPGGSNTQIQYNNAGAFAGAQNVLVEGNELRLPHVAAPSNPTASGLKLFGRDAGGRIVPAFSNIESVRAQLLQSSVAEGLFRLFKPHGNGTTLTSIGVTSVGVGTATQANMTNGTRRDRMQRIEYRVTVAATTAVAGWYDNSGGVTVGGGNSWEGGFWTTMHGGPSTGNTNASKRFFMGLAPTGAPTDVNPSTLLSIVGIGYDSADANLQFMTNDGTGTATKVDLGASFAKPTVDFTGTYRLRMYSPPGTTSKVYYEVTNLENGAVATGTVTTDLPGNTAFIVNKIYASVGGVSSVVGVTVGTITTQTEE